MNISVENTSGIPVAVWVIGFLILAAIVIYAISRGHNVKIGPVEFESKGDRPARQNSQKESQPSAPNPKEEKKLDLTADPLAEGKAHLFGTTRSLDYELAYRYLKRAADAGRQEAVYLLGYMYEKGLHVPIDYQKAMELYRKAADQGVVAAMNNIGFMYENGLGVAQDFKTAAEWYIRAADEGEPVAMGNAGRMYKNGKGVPKDLEKAVEYYRKAISMGDDSSMNNLAVLYADGIGVPQDLAQAVHWYKEAAKNGNKSAPRALERMKVSHPELFS